MKKYLNPSDEERMAYDKNALYSDFDYKEKNGQLHRNLIIGFQN